MIFLYFLNHLNLPTRFVNICPLNTRIEFSVLNKKILAHFPFQMSKCDVKLVYLTLVFTESEAFSPIMKLSFERTKKRGLSYVLLHISFKHMLGFQDFLFDHLKTFCRKNNYPPNFVDSCINSFLNKFYILGDIVQNTPKRDVFVKFWFFGIVSFQILKELQKLFIDKLTSCNIKIIFTAPVRDL